MGGARGADAQAQALLTAAAIRSPEDTFGVLKDLLGNLERRLSVVRVDVTRHTELANATPSIWPTLGWLTSGFGRRTDPFTGGPDVHAGLDIAADRGHPVYATANGVVQGAGWSGDYGNMVIITHESGLTTRYAHLSRMAVTAGTTVKRGDVVGFVGSTGRSTSPHLHYEVLANGRAAESAAAADRQAYAVERQTRNPAPLPLSQERGLLFRCNQVTRIFPRSSERYFSDAWTLAIRSVCARWSVRLIST